jgi:ATP-dependent 26S proteasome regulatory subunit
MAADQRREIETLICARYPILYVVSWEEDRVEETLQQVCRSRGKKLFVWTCTMGLLPAGSRAYRQDTVQPVPALDEIMESRDSAVFLLKDFHSYLQDPIIVRKLRDLTFALKRSYKTLVILSPILELPRELEKEVTVVDYELPTLDEIGAQLDRIIEQVKHDERIKCDLTVEQREQICKAAQGLTAIEVDNVFAKSLVERQCFDPEVILAEKQQIVRKSGLLEYFPAKESFEGVGGLDVLKDWLRKRAQAFSDRAREFGLPEPKGVLLIGVQGCGKSLSAKAVASLYRLPLLRLDVGNVFSGIIGSSEERMRQAIKIAESVSPCVLWIDEIEKGFSGTQSSGFSDAGTTARVFATFITWLQEKKDPVFVIATANDITVLPPELFRKGRFDDIFFVDLPTVDERKDILAIHFRKRKRDPAAFDLESLAKQSPGFSGAELEEAIIAGMFDAFDAGREVSTEDVLRNLRGSFPLSMTMRESIEFLREWARTRARPASSHEREDLGASQAQELAQSLLAGLHEEAAAEPAASAPASPETAPEPQEVPAPLPAEPSP